jgi:hypothetical protein
MKTLRTIAAVALLTVIPHAHAADIPAVGDKVVSSTETLACKTSEDTTRIHELLQQDDILASVRYQHEHGCRFLDKGTHGVLEKITAGASRPVRKHLGRALISPPSFARRPAGAGVPLQMPRSPCRH